MKKITEITRNVFIFLVAGIFIAYSTLIISWWFTTNVIHLIIETTSNGPTIVPRVLTEYILFNFRCGKNDITELKTNHGGLNFIIASLSDSQVSNEKKAKYVKFFISNDCSVNDVSAFDGFRPLHSAVFNRKPEMIELLLANGANPLLKSERKDMENMTPLVLAEMLQKKQPDTDYAKIIQILRKAELNWNGKRLRVSPAKP